MDKQLTLDEKYDILKRNNPLEGKGGELLTKVLIGAGLGGGASYLLAHDDVKNEDPTARRKRILRNTLLGTALGAGVTGGLSAANTYMNSAIPVIRDTPPEKSKGLLGKAVAGTVGGLFGVHADAKARERSIGVLRSILGESKVAPGTNLQAISATLSTKPNKNTKDLFELIKKVRNGSNKSKPLRKAVKHLGLLKGNKAMKLLRRNKWTALIAGLGLTSPWLGGKVVSGIKNLAGPDDLD